jgi:hypothetical protein
MEAFGIHSSLPWLVKVLLWGGILGDIFAKVCVAFQNCTTPTDPLSNVI